jgi:L-alanine-DL-glutamate epimerase-like enolase superfamily enzyme
MTSIESVSVCVTRVPLDKVTSFATRTVSARDYCLVKVRSSEGVDGIGFCYVGSTAGRIALAAVEELLAPKLIGQDPYRVEGLWLEMYAEALLQGRAGTVVRAISILDTAIWDLNARSVKLPLHRYLGSVAKDRVPAYASGGYYLDGKTPKKLGDEMASYVDAGFSAVKMKVGRLSPKEEEARIKAARAAIGPDVLLMLDANNAWPDLPTAKRYMDRYEPYNPYWIEEPFSPDDIDLHARLARSIKTTGRDRRNRLWTLVPQGTARQGWRGDPADGRTCLWWHFGVATDRCNGRQLRRHGKPPLVPRPARASGRVHAKRQVRGILH